VQAVRTLGTSLDDYSEVLGSICQEEAKEAKAIKEAAQSPKDNRNGNRNSKSVTNDGVARVGEDEEFNDLDGRKVEQKPEEATKKSRRKPSHSTKSAKPSEKMIDSEGHRKKVPCSSHEDQEVAYAVTSRRAYNVESQVMASPSASDSLPDENHSEKLCEAETKDSPSNVEVAEAVSKKVSEEASISKAKPVKQPVRKVLGQNSGIKKTAGTDSGKKQSGSASGADAKKHSAKKLDDNEGGGGSSSRQLVDKKKRGQEVLFHAFLNIFFPVIIFYYYFNTILFCFILFKNKLLMESLFFVNIGNGFFSKVWYQIIWRWKVRGDYHDKWKEETRLGKKKCVYLVWHLHLISKNNMKSSWCVH